MDPTNADDRPVRRHPLIEAVRSLLVLPLPPQGTRLIDIVALFVGIPLALLLCLPILLITVISAMPIGIVLDRTGAPEALQTAYGLGTFVGGLAVCFFVLLIVYRRLPAAVKRLITSDDEDDAALGA